MASARSLKVFPERFAIPYSVATLWIMVRSAETVEPPGMNRTMLDFKVPSFAFLAGLMQMYPFPPTERLRPQEIHLATDAGELAGSCGLSILLTHKVKLHAAIDADDILHGSDALRIMDIIEVSRVEKLRILRDPVIEFLRIPLRVPGGESRCQILFFAFVSFPAFQRFK